MSLMRLKSLEINGFKSFAKKTSLEFDNSIVSIVGPNGSGKSNVVEAIRFVLGEQSMKSMRGSSGGDMVFKGSKNLPKGSRASVTIYFDNSDKIFKLSNEAGESVNLNYDTVSISREVYADGLNKYLLNGGEARLKDIHNLLASVNIGASQHHIISQGEADRILNASPKDRREMIEEALGLKVYQYKIKEASRKLERTATNMKEVASLRRENLPHINFLKKQMDKLEKAKEMQVLLIDLYREYLKKESLYIEKEQSYFLSEKNILMGSLKDIDDKIAFIDGVDKKDLSVETEESQKEKDLKVLEKSIVEINEVKNELERKFGRVEAMLEMEERKSVRAPEAVIISQDKIKSTVREIDMSLDEAIAKNSLEEIRPILLSIKDVITKFNYTAKSETEPIVNTNTELDSLKQNYQEILTKIQSIKEEEKRIFAKIEITKKEILAENESFHNKEKEIFNLRVKKQEVSSALSLLSIKSENLARENESFMNEIKEGSVLVGNEVMSYKESEISNDVVINRFEQEELKRKIERIKIKLEDAGLGNSSDVLKEYKEVSERDNFLAKEMEDLVKSIESLKSLMSDLKEKIDSEFKEGIKKINIEFNNFFSLMFGGGSAYLSIVTENKKKKEVFEEIEGENNEEIVFEQGVDIDIALPHKKVKELNALSGGERSLTSIAILFAMSQVNPPPFLVLDETDAALDEANSRKYGDMLERLAHHSQLVVVTHNRETMSRAGILYGVTIGADGASKLLSVKLDEAQAIAK